MATAMLGALGFLFFRTARHLPLTTAKLMDVVATISSPHLSDTTSVIRGLLYMDTRRLKKYFCVFHLCLCSSMWERVCLNSL